jgi:hypothetical protein
LGAAFLCAEFGFDGDVRNAGYIASWIELLKADKPAFFTACSHASKAALQQACREPIHDIHPLTGVKIEVVYADRALETFRRGGAGWFCWKTASCP